MTMSEPIEAQSLSSLTTLFANPPQYPRNPTHYVHEPLTLYIVRVPGSRDVFLSPVKPPTKSSISLEAVQHSLYYLHVNTEEDEQVKEAADRQRISDGSSRPSVTVARKPVPLSNHPLPPLPAESHPHEAYHPTLPPRGLSLDRTAENTAPLRVDTSTLVGSRSGLITLTGAPSLYNPADDYAVSPVNRQHRLHRLSTRDLLPNGARARDGLSNSSHQQNGSTSAVSSPSLSQAPYQDVAKFPLITIIRRDPTSGSQWNIGTITTSTSTFTASNLKPVYIELTAPGYGRFTRPGFETSRPGSSGTDAASVRRAMISAPASATSPDTPVAPFTRVVDFRKMAWSELRRTMYQRTNSSETLARFEPLQPSLEKNVLAFDSPWHGVCTFVNAIDGKTLKMKHTINGNSSSGERVTADIAELRFNLGWSILSNIKDTHNRRKIIEPDKLPIPRLLENKKDKFRKSFQHLKEKSRESFQRSRSADGRDDEVFRNLSNLQTPTRNNLDDNMWPRTTAPSNGGPVNHTINYPQTHLAHQTFSEDNEDDEGRLSLKLGRERAGGGFRGHSAKLGKLIIENEGLKMCDLVVGAAMGIWWQHYGG